MWNTIAGAAQLLWNGVVAVATFFVAAVVWLANVAIGLTIGLVTGNWTYFETNVVEPLKKALEAFLQFIVNLVTAALRGLVDGLLKPVLAPVQSAVARVMAGMKQALGIDPPLGVTLTSLFLEALPILLLLSTVILLIMIGIGLAIQSFPIAGLLIAAVVTAILWAVFLAMIPKDPSATNPANTLAFLSQFDQDYGRPVFLFGLFEVWGGPIVAALSVWDEPPGAEDFAVLAAILWDMFVFFVDAIAEGTEGRSAGACALGVFGLTASGIGIALSMQAVLKFPRGRGPGPTIAYFLLTSSLLVLALLSFGADSGYVLNHCG